jgi:hypothetical protein
MATKKEILKENKRLAELKRSDRLKKWEKEGVNQINRNFMESAQKN